MFESPESKCRGGDLETQLIHRLKQRVRMFAFIVAALRVAPVFLGPAWEKASSS